MSRHKLHKKACKYNNTANVKLVKIQMLEYDQI